MKIKKLRISNGRNYLNSKKLAHVVWNEHNPDNPWRKGFVIHHKDGNSLNDDINNLELMTSTAHTILHHTGNQNNKGKTFSKEWCNKMSKSRLGKRPTDETKIKMSKSQSGRVFSDETKKKISESLKGHKAWNKGKPFSDETRKKMSIAMLGRPVSEETRKKISLANSGDKNGFFGHKHSEETKLKMSEHHKRKIV